MQQEGRGDELETELYVFDAGGWLGDNRLLHIVADCCRGSHCGRVAPAGGVRRRIEAGLGVRADVRNQSPVFFRRGCPSDL
jgi:hypothetical protein